MAVEIVKFGNKINLDQKFEATCHVCGTVYTFRRRDARNSYQFIECPRCNHTRDVSTCKKIDG